MSKQAKPDTPVKLSADVVSYLNRRRSKGESFDAALRRHFGLPGRKGQDNTLQEFLIAPDEERPRAFTLEQEAEARGFMIQKEVRRGNRKVMAKLIRVREVAEL